MESHEKDNDSLYSTPNQSSQQPHSRSSRWNFDSLNASPSPSSSRPTDPNPRQRRASLPRTLFSSTAASIFGSGETRSVQTRDERHPTFAVSPPTPESLGNFHSAPGASSASSKASKSGPEWYDGDDGTVIVNRHIPQAEKDADDPTAPPASPSRRGMSRQESTTLTTLSRLFAVRAPISPPTSRTSSYIQPPKPLSHYARSLAGETAALPDHLYNRGLLQGRHSDITVHAFGRPYSLHRIILDRAPYFRSALSEPWLEARAKETTIHPEDIDSTITQSSFELALKRIYGCSTLHEEDSDAIGLFATGCWLEMQDLIESSVESMLRQMTNETLSPLIKLVTSSYYGRAGDKILASAKAMLCRDGWKMPLRYWDGIPGDIIREIVGGDGFFIEGEWERWMLAKRILDRRLRHRAVDAGLSKPGSRRKAEKAPTTAASMAVRFDTTYRRSGGRGYSDALHKWVSLYTHPDVGPILVLLDEGVHYIHLDFEQLQFIRNARDILGFPVMPDKVISNALWQQMELRQKVMNACEVHTELDLSIKCTEDSTVSEAGRDTTMSITTPASPPAPTKGKHKVEDVPDAEEDNPESGSWDGNGKPRKFWIPSSDCNIVMGGNADPVIATSNNTTLQRHASRLSATLQPEDVQWASDFAAVTSHPRYPPASGDNGAPGVESGIGDVLYTHFPPFRFAAEFPNPRLLKERKRVYSRTVFYAGSLWNIYIQKVNSSRSKQLGVYLHRAKEREAEDVIAGTTGLSQGSVDDRIGQLEREMILRSERDERRQRRRTTIGGEIPDPDGGDSSGSAGELDPTTNESSSSARPNSMRGLLSRARQRRSEQADMAGTSSHSNSSSNANGQPDLLTPDSNSEDSDSENERPVTASKRSHVPTLPPYVDVRPTIKTYFKIYSPSRGGRMLSVYESAPDQFNFSQSWGWKSSTLMLDEGLLGTDGDDRNDALGDGEKSGAGAGAKGDGRLRFMVVIGNI